MYTVYTYKCMVLADPTHIPVPCAKNRCKDSCISSDPFFSPLTFRMFCRVSIQLTANYLEASLTMAMMINCPLLVRRLGQTVYIHRTGISKYLVIPLPKIPCIHRIYMVLANPIDMS
jgi:hypothetical protein